MTHKIISILQNDDRPYETLLVLHQSGELQSLCPELCELYTDESGYKNNFIHTMGVLKNVCDKKGDFKMKLVALLHDIGKIKTKKLTDKGWTFHNHEQVSAQMSKLILDDLFIYDLELIKYVYRMIFYHGRIKMHRDVSESAIRRLDNEVGRDIIFDLIEFCKNDMTTKFDDKRDRITASLDTIKQRIIEVREKDEDAKWRSPLTGNMVMELLGIGEGRVIGEIKRKLDPKLKTGEIELSDAIEYININYLNK
jgi:poly(A) polymerase